MTEPPSYIDYETFLDRSFSPTAFANGLILSTNNASDTPLDLSTPLSRVLFDVQEIDTHIHTLTTKSAVPLLSHTKQGTEASKRILEEVQAQVTTLTDAYQRLETEVGQRWEAAAEVRTVTERLWETVKIGRSVGRCLTLGRQLEAQMTEVGGGAGSSKRDDHRAMIRASNTVLALRQLFSATEPGQEGEALGRINAVQTLRRELATPAEGALRARAQQIVREFSMSSLSAAAAPSSTSSALSAPAATYAQTEATKTRTASACVSLYLLSDASTAARRSAETGSFSPDLLITALTTYLQTSVTSSAAALSRALTSLPSLDRTLLEVAARCQNIVALEALLETIRPPVHALLPTTTSSVTSKTDTAPPTPANLLEPLLQTLDTSSLPSYFWRSLASSLGSRVQEIVTRGGAPARAMRSNKDRIRDGIRECVVRGSKVPDGVGFKGRAANGAGTNRAGAAGPGWEREAAVMVGAVVGGLAR